MMAVLGDLISKWVDAGPSSIAIEHKNQSVSYSELNMYAGQFAAGLLELGLARFDRVGIYLGKQVETVTAIFGTSAAGGVFVPINPVLKSQQVLHIVNDCDVRVLVTSRSRLQSLSAVIGRCRALQHVIVVDFIDSDDTAVASLSWDTVMQSTGGRRPRVIASDMAAILYTSGSTGKPKGVVLSHQNMTVGAASVSQYLRNTSDDRILALLPLSFDAGLSQITTGLYAGARVVLHEHLFSRDVVRIVQKNQITGITGVPPLWFQLVRENWPEGAAESVRYFANTGGKMPVEMLARLRKLFANAEPFMMYGLTEAFRSTYLPPACIDQRPESIGKAIPNAEILVVDENGEQCPPGVPGELVHRGPLVSMGYWNDPEKTQKRFRPSPNQPEGITNPDMAVWSGDTVYADEEGFLYFVGRRDDMIKTSGYRVSPTEVEELAYTSELVAEAAAFGVADDGLGAAIVLVVKARDADVDPTESLLAFYKSRAPNYMVPGKILCTTSIPRNANGKIDRKALADNYMAPTDGRDGQ